MIDDLPIADLPGLSHGTLSLSEADPTWSTLAEGERCRILEACGQVIIESAHIGGTSIPGMPARPVIDLLLGVAEMMHSGETIQPMKSIGYRCHGEQGVPGRRFFSLSNNQRTLVHVHLYRVGAPLWERAIGVHDRLTHDAALAKEYRVLREKAVQADAGDLAAYEDLKRQFEDRLMAS